MSLTEEHLKRQLANLRHHFDHAFSLPVAEQGAPQVNLLSIGLRDKAFAVALLELRGVHRRPKTTPLPGIASELLGVVGIRGVLVPVYDLGALLGLPRESDSPWLALTQDQNVGFAFDEFQGHTKLDRGLYEQATLDNSGLFRIPELSATGGRPIVNLPAIVAVIAQRASHNTPIKDRLE